jgi:hypothetical protein
MDTIVSEHAIITGTWTYLEICPSGVGPEPGEYIFHCPLLRLGVVSINCYEQNITG